MLLKTFWGLIELKFCGFQVIYDNKVKYVASTIVGNSTLTPKRCSNILRFEQRPLVGNKKFPWRDQILIHARQQEQNLVYSSGKKLMPFIQAEWKNWCFSSKLSKKADAFNV